MIHFEPFLTSDFQRLQSWIVDERFLYQFAGRLFSFPLNDEQLRAYLADSQLFPKKIVESKTGKTIGHCEFNTKKNRFTISRILIGEPTQRGKGMGEVIVRKMVRELFNSFGASKVFLHVFDWNQQAISCYEKVGFRVVFDESTTLRVQGQTWTRLLMVLKHEPFD